ncbi:MAG: DUF6020 family protein [Clostridia bacterium]
MHSQLCAEKATLSRLIQSALAGMLIGLALTADYSVAMGSAAQGTPFIAALLQQLNALLLLPTASSAIAIFGGLLFERASRKQRFFPLFLLASVLFGFAQVCGNSVQQTDSLNFLLGNASQAVIGTLCALGWAMLCYACLLLLYAHLTKAPSQTQAPWLCRAPFLKAFGCLAAVYLLWAIVCYPGNVDWDTYAALNSAFSATPSDAHPMLFTWILGSCVALGRACGSDNLGMFLFVLLQLLACAAAFACVISTFLHYGLHRLAVLTLAFFALTPLWGMYILLGNKDVLFTVCFCLFVLLTLQSLRKPTHARFWAAYTGVMVVCALLRHGMGFLVFPVGLLAMLLALRGKALLCGSALLLSGLLALFGFQNLLLPSLGIESASPLEPLCLPFQQAARTVRDAPQTLSDVEIAALDALLDVETMGSQYRPQNADTVKGIPYAKVLPPRELKAAILDFLSVWKDMLWEHPRIYLEAWIALSSDYWTFPISAQGIEVWYPDGVNTSAGTNHGAFAFSQPAALAGAQQTLMGYGKLFRSIPILGLLHQPGFYTWLMLGLFCCLLQARQWRPLTVLLAPFLVLALCTASPINGYMRYFLPVAASAPIMLACTRMALASQSNAASAPR